VGVNDYGWRLEDAREILPAAKVPAFLVPP